MRRVGLVTIGQSPRDDIMSVLGNYLPRGCEPVQAGMLDGASPQELRALAPRPGEQVLVTRLQDGTEVRLGRDRITGRLANVMRGLDRMGLQVIALLCTDRFPSLFVPFSLRALVVEPDKLLLGSVGALARGRSLGVVVPSPEQMEGTRESWQGICRTVHVVTASAYAPMESLERAAQQLARGEGEGAAGAAGWTNAAGAPSVSTGGGPPDLVVMDCMGFGREHKRLVSQIVGRPVVLASSIVGKMLSEFVD